MSAQKKYIFQNSSSIERHMRDAPSCILENYNIREIVLQRGPGSLEGRRAPGDYKSGGWQGLWSMRGDRAIGVWAAIMY